MRDNFWQRLWRGTAFPTAEHRSRSRKNKQSSSHSVRRYRPRLERLEDRTLLSGYINFDPTTGTLSVLGDTTNDTITIKTYDADGIYYGVTDQVGNTTYSGSFLAATVNTIKIDAKGGVNTIYLHDVTGGTTVNVTNSGGGDDDVYVGQLPGSTSGTLGDIAGAIHVSNAAGSDLLYIDDHSDTTGRAATLNDGSLTWSNYAGPITWTPTTSTGGVGAVYVVGGSGGNTFTVNNTSRLEPGQTTDLETGTGTNRVNVLGTTGSLEVDGESGNNTVVVGSTGSRGSLAAIQGKVLVSNYFNEGATSLTVDDSSDTIGRTATLNAGSLTWSNYAAPIEWGMISGLTVYGGSGGNTFTVNDTSNLANGTGLSTGGGTNTVNVLGTTGGLGIAAVSERHDTVTVGSATGSGGSLAAIQGIVEVIGLHEPADLTVDDSGDATGRSATLNSNSLTWTNYAAPIEWGYDINSVTVNGGSGGNNFTVANTNILPNGTTLNTGAGANTVNVQAATGPLNVKGGGGADTVNVGNNNSLQNITGAVTIANSSSLTHININDSADAGNRNATIGSGGVTGLAPAAINFTAASVSALTINGGSGSNTYTVTGTPSSQDTFLFTGTGPCNVYVLDTTSELDIDPNSPTANVSANVTVGSTTGSGGSLAAIQGAVHVYNFYVRDNIQLTVDDSGDTTGRTATLDSGSLTWSNYAAPVYWDFGTANATIDGGSGGNTFTVNNSIAHTSTALYPGAGNNTVNVLGTTGSLGIVASAGGHDAVTVGSASGSGGTLATIQGMVGVAQPSGTLDLTVDDSGDATGRSATLNGNTLSWANYAAPVFWYGGINSVTVNGGRGGNHFGVLEIGFTPITLNTGAGNNRVDVGATFGPLNVKGGGGHDVVSVGDNSLFLITGAVNVANLTGETDLVVHDDGDTTGRTATLNDGSLTWTNYAAPITWTPTASATGGVGSMSIFGGSGNNTFNVNNTSNFSGEDLLETNIGSSRVNVLGATGGLSIVTDPAASATATVDVGSTTGTGGSLAAIQGFVSVSNGSIGNTDLIVDDSGDTTGQSATLDSGGLTWGSYAAPISWSSGVALEVEGGSGGNTFTVNNTPLYRSGLIGTTLITGTGSNTASVLGTTGGLFIEGDGGQDAVTVGSASGSGGSLAAIQGIVEVAAVSSLTVDDSGDATGQTAAFGSGFLNWTNYAASVEWDNSVASVTVNGGSGGNTFTVESNITFASNLTLNAGSGNDTVKMTGPVNFALTVSDQGGNNTLDYSGYTGNVTVDIPLGVATLISGGISGFQNVIGSQGNDILVGDGSGNVLTGGTGRNLLIAGAGAATLIGNSADDIFVAGSTNYDTNLAALDAIFAEWTRTDLDFAERANHILNGGGLNGSVVLNASTVTGNGGGNTLTGDGESALIFSDGSDTVSGFAPGSLTVTISD